MSGIVIVVVGALTEHFYRAYLNSLAPSLAFASPPLVLIGVGVVVLVVGVVGCCGAVTSNRCLIILVRDVYFYVDI